MKLPLYNIAGDEEPCGSFGEGVKVVLKWLEEAGIVAFLNNALA